MKTPPLDCRIQPHRIPLLRLSLFAALVSLGLAPAARAQGCSQCRDTTAGSAPQARKALAHAIPLLGIPAAGVFLGGLLLARNIQPGSRPD